MQAGNGEKERHLQRAIHLTDSSGKADQNLNKANNKEEKDNPTQTQIIFAHITPPENEIEGENNLFATDHGHFPQTA